MALLPQDPRQQVYVLVVVLALAAGVFGYMRPYRDKLEELREMEDRLAELEHQNRLAESRIGDLEELRQRLRRSERVFASLERLVPSRAEVPAIFEAIATETQALGLRLINVAPAAPVADSGAYFLRQDWEMQVQGEYHAIGNLLTRVASFDRIVRPQIQEIRPAETTPSGRQLVEATFGLETFVLPPPEHLALDEGSSE
ncbi:MAG: type 4a pilus biogenesis protein PilO [Gemmatimonadota bacterium]